jgi:DNA-binding winged helix-turn-helix (wHTH) protein
MSNTKPTIDVEQQYGPKSHGLRYQFSDFVLCTRQNILMRGDQMVMLTEKALKCLTLLVTNPNQLVFRESFFDEVWSDCFVGDGVLNVNISCLRKVLGKDAIKTYSGKGYTFKYRVEVVGEEPLQSAPRQVSSVPTAVRRTHAAFVNRLRAMVVPSYSKFAH